MTVYWTSRNRRIKLREAFSTGTFIIKRIDIPKKEDKAVAKCFGVRFYDIRSGKWAYHRDKIMHKEII